jgi:hypothetical protein
MANFAEVDSIANYVAGNTYTFLYNDKLRQVRVERVLEAAATGKQSFLHCTVIAEDGEQCPPDTFKNFTIAKIQG